MDDTRPTSRALRALELVQLRPGISAPQLGDELGVTDRAARRYVAMLREAGIPVVAERGPYGGYRLGRGTRLPPLMFTAREALALVMAVLEASPPADPTHPVASGLAKFVRVLPEPLARSAELVRSQSTRDRPAGYDGEDTTPDPELTARLVRACDDGHRIRVGYRRGPDRRVALDVDPWAVVVRRGRWFLLCLLHGATGGGAGVRRSLRVDRVLSVETLPEPFERPRDLDPLRALEEQLSQGWRLSVIIEIDAPPDRVRLSRSLGRLEATDDGRTRLLASTNEPDWYAVQLAALDVAFRVLEPPELRDAVRRLGQRLVEAAGGAGA